MCTLSVVDFVPRTRLLHTFYSFIAFSGRSGLNVALKILICSTSLSVYMFTQIQVIEFGRSADIQEKKVQITVISRIFSEFHFFFFM